MEPKRQSLLDEIIQAIPAWQVLVVQFNDAVAKSLGITASDMQCLFVLSRNGPCTPGVIAETIGINTGSASRMVDRLLVAGLVTRTSDEHDRRRVIVAATQSALDRIAVHYDPLNATLRNHLDSMDDLALKQMLEFVDNAERSTEAHLRQLSQI